jgi:hypothetical protein
MKINSCSQSKKLKAMEADIPMGLNLSNVKVKRVAAGLVLLRLGIDTEILKRMGVDELRTLYLLLAEATSIVASESARRGLTGKKT